MISGCHVHFCADIFALNHSRAQGVFVPHLLSIGIIMNLYGSFYIRVLIVRTLFSASFQYFILLWKGLSSQQSPSAGAALMERKSYIKPSPKWSEHSRWLTCEKIFSQCPHKLS